MGMREACRPARGVVLTEKGLQCLEQALKCWWEQEPLEYKVRHRKLAQEAIAEKLGVNIKTVRKIRLRQAVDRETLRAAFKALGLAWNDAYCIHAALRQAERENASADPLPPDYIPHIPPCHTVIAGAVDAKEAPGPWPSFPKMHRDRERDEIVEILSVSRLVTLTGIGGVGKSQLARDVEAAWAALHHPYPTHWVDMSVELTSSSEAAALILEQKLGMREQERIAGYLAECSLVVLDNFEQARTPGDPFVRTLLRACPAIRVVVTSRHILGVPGEIVRPILPLAVPIPREVQRRDDRVGFVSAFPGIQLFVQVLQTLQPRFQLTEENVEQVASLCYSLDGVPRAVEIAAMLMAKYAQRRGAAENLQCAASPVLDHAQHPLLSR